MYLESLLLGAYVFILAASVVPVPEAYMSFMLLFGGLIGFLQRFIFYFIYL